MVFHTMIQRQKTFYFPKWEDKLKKKFKSSTKLYQDNRSSSRALTQMQKQMCKLKDIKVQEVTTWGGFM